MRTVMTTMDLLPESVQSTRGKRTHVIRLATVQVAIFLCLGLAVFGMHNLVRRSEYALVNIRQEVNTLSNSPEILAAAYARDRLHEDAFILAHGPLDFDPVWVGAILAADYGEMVALAYDGQFVLVTGAVDDIGQIEDFRQRLLAWDVFEDVNLGGINSQDDGFSFELRISVHNLQ